MDSFNRDPIKCKCGFTLRYAYTYDQNVITESTEISVLMKCTNCRYEEEVPKWVLEELEFGRIENGYKMACPCFDSLMLEKSIFENSNIFKPKKPKKKKKKR